MNTDEAEVVACVIDFIMHEQGMCEFLCFIEDDEECVKWLDGFRESWMQVHRQCHDLCELMPAHADKWHWQLGEFERATEAELAKKLKKYPWTLLRREAREALALGYEPDHAVSVKSVQSVVL